MVFPLTTARFPLAAMKPSVMVLIDRMPYSVPEAVPLLLRRLSKLTSLGDGLRGCWLSSAVLVWSDLSRVNGAPELVGVWGAASDTPVSGRLRAVLGLLLLEIGSKEMMRGLGSGIGAMSIASLRYTLASQDVVGNMVVGRVNVDVSM
jgi:hypothetical protein